VNLGRVVGTIVASQQHPFYEGRKQLLVEYVRPDGEPDGDRYVIAVDLVGAGVGERVLVKDEGTSARQMLGTDANGPVRSVVVGIVDAVNYTESE
jgi:ethanolamine utilization protein EutN